MLIKDCKKIKGNDIRISDFLILFGRLSWDYFTSCYIMVLRLAEGNNESALVGIFRRRILY
jgi:hypothetical protein